MQNQSEITSEPQIVFKKEISAEQKCKLQQKTSKFISKKNLFKISDGQWKQQKVSETIKYIERINSNDMLFLTKNKEPQIMKQLCHIHFPYLNQIYIGDNEIFTIQPLVHLNSPNLETLWMQNNRITSLKLLSHSNFPKLKYLRVSQNYLIDSQDISSMQISFPLSLFLEQNKFGITQFQDISLFAKLQNWNHQEEQFFYIFGQQRIGQTSVIECLKKKVKLLIVGQNIVI